MNQKVWNKLRTGVRVALRNSVALYLLTVPQMLIGNQASIVPATSEVSDFNTLKTLAQLKSTMGQAAESRKIYLRLIGEQSENSELLLTYANSALSWGDFGISEAIYTKHLQRSPEDWHVWIKLGETLKASQQLDRAEGHYRKLIMLQPENTEYTLGLFGVQTDAHDYASALNTIEIILEKDPSNTRAAAGKAMTLFQLKRWDQAISEYTKLSSTPGFELESALGLGRIYLAQNEQNKAKKAFMDALTIEPKNVEAQFHKAGPDKTQTESFILEILNKNNPAELIEWSRFYHTAGQSSTALRLNQKAFTISPEYFPTNAGLAQALALDRQYNKALAMYKQILIEFPGNLKIMTEKARILSWDRRYDDAILLYEQIAAMNPENAVPLIEMARVAAWAKEMIKSIEVYSLLLHPSVDEQLLKKLDEFAKKNDSETVEKLNAQLNNTSSATPYDIYEFFINTIATNITDYPENLRKELELIKTDLLSDYRIQKTAYLEKTGKRLAWHKRFLRALKPYRELIAFAPGNQEAWHDLAQVEFALGLNREAVSSLSSLFDIDPSHGSAGLIQETMNIRNNTSATAGYSYWHEAGRDDLVNITRHRWDIGAGATILKRTRIQGNAHHWREQPGGGSRAFIADGFSLQVEGVMTPWLSTGGEITLKNYNTSGIDNSTSARAEAALNINDIITTAVSVQRADEIYNRFCIEQGIQSDSLTIAGRSLFSRATELNAYIKMIEYSDDNSGKHAHLNISMTATEHPRIIKGGIFGEFRDTDKTTIRPNDEESLIIHPYWTPENYAAWGFMLQWHDDRSAIFSKGTETRFYTLTLILRDDTENNQTIELKGKLNWEWYLRWIAGVEAAVIRSGDWNAEGLWLTLKRHF